MLSHREHVEAICGHYELALRLGLAQHVEEARDAHLRSLDADDALGALLVEWQELVAHLSHREAERAERDRAERRRARRRRRAKAKGRRRR